MKNKFSVGDTVYLIANRLYVRRVDIIKISGDLYTVVFRNDFGIGETATRVRGNRLFASEKDAQAVVDGFALPYELSRPTNQEPRKTHWDYP